MIVKPKCKLVGVDGNVFIIIGHVSQTLKKAGMVKEAKEFIEKACHAESYDDVIALTFDYVDIC